ncbi:hypothetical protein [Paenibacillus mesotrionivorans]|uniref:Uncharacterized protein n=1 Tax=Paenibacillus mesotrionivorans TaxID=3160968 RepID=A0ACC7NYA2_9BACL
MLSPDESLKIFLELKKEYIGFSEEDLNETETRLKILDSMLTQVLGWPQSQIKAEVPLGETEADNNHKKLYIDYLLISDHNNFLLEAKKTGASIQLANSTHRTFVRGGVVYNSNKKFLDQAKNYMVKLGTPFSLVTNGHIFIVQRMPIFEHSKNLLVFKSWDDIESKFIDFWNILSPYSNGIEALDLILNTPDELRSPPAYRKKLYDHLQKKDKFPLATSDITLAIEDHLDRFFGDLNSEYLMDLCYCDPSPDITSSLTDNLRRRLVVEPVSTVQLVSTKTVYGVDGNFGRDYLSTISQEGTVYVLLGEVGAGKSTFLTHFYLKELDDNIKDQLIWIRINFLNFTDFGLEKLNSFITSEIYKILDSEYSHLSLTKWEIREAIYEKEVSEFSESLPEPLRQEKSFYIKELYTYIMSLVNSKEEHLEKIFSYIKYKLNKNVCFVFDNIDQRPADQQREVLMIAYNRSKIYKGTVITAMRHQYYYMIKGKPPFDAISVHDYRIQAPKIRDLLEKRLEAFNKFPSKDVIYDLRGKTIKIPIEKFVRILRNTIQNQDEVNLFFENISGGNMRRLLEMFKAFVLSENSKIHEIIRIRRIVENVDNVSVDFQYVLDSIVRENQKFYNSEISLIKNLFLYYNDGFYSHFSQIYILYYLQIRSHVQTQTDKGYVDIEDVLQKFSAIFLNEEKLNSLLLPLLNEFLIDSNMGARESLNGTTSIRISEVGEYYINCLLNDWKYISYVLIDTPIRDHEKGTKIWKKYQQSISAENKNFKTHLLQEAVCMFLEYLEESEKEDLKYILSSTEGKVVPFKPIVPELKKQIVASMKRDI